MFTIREIYITRQQSLLLRGVAMIAVVLGHNIILQTLYWNMREYFYLFHLSLFFTLPFFYKDSKTLSLKNCIDLMVRCFVPYIFFFTLSYLFNVYMFRNVTLNWNIYIKGLFWVDSQISGVIFLWFLPAYFFSSILRMMAIKYGWWFKLLILFCGVLMCVDWNYTWNILFKNIPLCMMQGIYYCSIAIATHTLMTRLPQWFTYIGIILFIQYTILHFTTPVYEYLNEWCRSIIAILAFMTILNMTAYFRRISDKISFLIGQFGNYSMEIYLLHVYIYFAILPFFSTTLSGGILYFICALCLSLIVAVCWRKTPFLQSLIIPKSMQDWIVGRVYRQIHYEK